MDRDIAARIDSVGSVSAGASGHVGDGGVSEGALRDTRKGQKHCRMQTKALQPNDERSRRALDW